MHALASGLEHPTSDPAAMRPALDPERLKAALKEAVETIHVWHGFGPEWEIYLRCSPEMKRITASLTPAEIDALIEEPQS